MVADLEALASAVLTAISFFTAMAVLVHYQDGTDEIVARLESRIATLEARIPAPENSPEGDQHDSAPAEVSPSS